MFFLSFKRTVFSKPIVLCRDEERVSILLPQVFSKKCVKQLKASLHEMPVAYVAMQSIHALYHLKAKAGRKRITIFG